jgi:hypothetical protein
VTERRFTATQLLADKATVAVAYRLAVRRLHPDVGGDRRCSGGSPRRGTSSRKTGLSRSGESH